MEGKKKLRQVSVRACACRPREDDSPIPEEGNQSGDLLDPRSALSRVKLFDRALTVVGTPRKGGELHTEHHLRASDLDRSDRDMGEVADDVAVEFERVSAVSRSCGLQ